MSAIDLGGLKTAKKTTAKVEKPTLPDHDGSFAKIVAESITHKGYVEAHTLALDQGKTKLYDAALAYIFKMGHGQATPEDTVQAVCDTGKALISAKNTYKIPADIEPVRALLGEHADTYLSSTTTITIDASAIPVKAQQFFINKLVEIARLADELMLGVEDDGPVFNAISVKQTPVLDKAFHADRHRLFTPEANMVIHQAMPCTMSVKLDY